MNKVLGLLLLWLMASAWVHAQVTSGPMLGPVTFRTASIWLELEQPASKAVVKYWPASGSKVQAREAFRLPTEGQARYNIQKFELSALEPATAYQYEVLVALPGKPAQPAPGAVGRFTTPELFQWRKPAPDVTFLTGSCSYFNEPRFDRPGKPYGGDSSIFETMAKEKAAFMLWLGDNWYTREVDYTSAWGLWYRPHRDRSAPVLQNLLKSMGHLAIWDDHDYGPNDYAKSYFLKNESLDAFRAYWLNPSHGDGKEGIYSRYQYNDVDFFLLDDRWWRDDESLPDSTGGKPNENKHMFGKKQLDWLKDELRISKRNPYVSFRIIATGSQVLNPVSPFDKMLNFQAEYNELVSFLRDEKIDGVLFLTGDRHHSEIIKVQPAGLYPLYDVTCSPLTSGTHKFGGKEANNPYRVLGIDQLQNYGRISVTGERNKRTLKVDFVGIKGETLGTWQVSETELRVGAGK